MVASGLVLPGSGRATGLWPSWISYSCFLLPLFLLGLLHPWKPLEPNTHGVNHSGGFTAISFWTPLGQGWAFLSMLEAPLGGCYQGTKRQTSWVSILVPSSPGRYHRKERGVSLMPVGWDKSWDVNTEDPHPKFPCNMYTGCSPKLPLGLGHETQAP